MIFKKNKKTSEFDEQFEKNHKKTLEFEEHKKVFDEYMNANADDSEYYNYEYFDSCLNDCFYSIYHSIDDIKDIFIVNSALKQIPISLDVVKKVYNIDDSYIDDRINTIFPELKTKMNNNIKEHPQVPVLFFPGEFRNMAPFYSDIIMRIDLYLETKRNQNKLLKELKDNKMIYKIFDNQQLLFLLNTFSVKDALIISSNLDLLDIDEDEVNNIYPHNDDYFADLFIGTNMAYVTDNLKDRISKISEMNIDNSLFDYQGLNEEYQDLEERINDTKEYLFSKKRR